MNQPMGKFRVGQGFDVHAFTTGDHVMLCGVRVPHVSGLAAHSDGDVALHALCDALLGACALGDIGRHFPPDDEHYAGADSLELTSQVMAKLGAAGWKVNNADITVVCEAPRLSAHIGAMTRAVTSVLEAEAGTVSVKATTTEGLGFCGRGEGIAAMAVVSLVSV